jgi:mandelamide amidase
MAVELYGGTTASDVSEWSATEAAQHIRSGSITAEAYTSQQLQRYRRFKGLNAITWIDENRVLESARAVDGARSRGQALGPLGGVPLVIKDNINTVGFPTTGGTAILKGNYPPDNAPVVDALLKAGGILFGKTNMDELGRGFTTSNPTFGFAKNPYDTSRVPGGGAGGTGAAISARIAPAGLGSDTAGSARIPVIVRPRPASGRNTGAWPRGRSSPGMTAFFLSLTQSQPRGRWVVRFPTLLFSMLW